MTTPTPPRRSPGPVTLYPGKIRKPLTFTATKEHRATLVRTCKRLKLSRSDTLGLLIATYADVLQLADVFTEAELR